MTPGDDARSPLGALPGRPLHIFGVAVFALLVHLLFLAVLPAEMRRNESTDYLEFYRPVAERLIDGRGLQDAEGRVAVRYPPGFPAVIATTVSVSRLLPGSEDLWLRILVALCVAASAGLVVALGSRLSGRWTVALLAGMGWSLYPPQLWMSKQPNSEIPFLVLILWGMLLWCQAWQGIETPSKSTPRLLGLALGAGLLIGLATLLRPIALLLAPVFVGVGLLAIFSAKPSDSKITSQGSSLRSFLPLALAILCGQILAVAPWILYVHAETDKWIPVSSGGRLSLLDGLTIGAEPGEKAPPMTEGALTITHEVQAHRAEIHGPLSAFTFLARRALEDPGPVLELGLIKAARSWYGTESVRHERYLLMIQVPALLLALLGSWRLWRTRPAAVLLILGVVAYFWAMTFLVLSILRYMVPAMALLVVPIAFLVIELTETWMARKDAGGMPTSKP